MELEYQETKLCKCVYMTEEEGKGAREGRMGRREREKGRRRKEEEKSIKQEHTICTSYPNMVVVLFGPMNFAISTA